MKSQSKTKITNLTPMIIEERAMNITGITVYDRLMMNRIIYLGEPIDDYVANTIISQLLFLDSQNNNPITIYINCPGGDVYSGLAIYDTMQLIKSPIHTVVAGFAASMAFVLATAGEKGNRKSLEHSTFMMHQPLQGGCGYKQATEIQIENDEIQRLKKDLFTIISNHSNLDVDTLTAMGERDKYLTPSQCIEYGFLDTIITKK